VTQEEFLKCQLADRLNGHIPDRVINEQCCQMILYYKKWGAQVNKKPIVDHFFEAVKKANNSRWIK